MTKSEFIQGYVEPKLQGAARVTLEDGDKALEVWRQELQRVLNAPAA